MFYMSFTTCFICQYFSSAVSFYQAQIALAHQWEGPHYTGADTPKEVFIKVLYLRLGRGAGMPCLFSFEGFDR
ncbi:hypothetical protein BDR03DRAFT_150781 [Suillus americanus]|nr:hypothetical protein BDR03DRAFT_150781 [Suillus americanus]